MIALHPGPVVFAVEDRAAQLTWRRLPAGTVTITCGDHRAELTADGGPGAHDVNDLLPDTAYTATVTTSTGTSRLRFRTLPTPPGKELYRFATLNDLHLGMSEFGIRWKLSEPGTEVEHPERCVRSALADLTAWGAQRLVLKGDIVHRSSDRNWALAAEVLRDVALPWTALPGNHDIAHGDPGAVGTARRHGIALVEDVESIDVPGLRLVLMNSAIEDRDVGRWHHLQHGATAAAAGTSGPAMLLVHHHPQPAPFPTHFPPGIDSTSARSFLRAVGAANPKLIGSSGHSHRNRLRTDLGVLWAEIGSPKDYPGVWAGYAVHEGGIRQVVRRVSAPDCLDWLDRTRRVAGGVWGLYSPGNRRDRCFSHAWPSTTPPAAPARRGT